MYVNASFTCCSYSCVSHVLSSALTFSGKGSFGHVQLVKHKKNGQTYALKAVSKAQIVQLCQQEHIMSEKNVMAMLDCIFLIKL